MPSVTEKYGIAGPVPFADVDVSCDNWLFLDAHAVRLSGEPLPFASEALHCIDTFMAEVVSCLLSGDPARYRRGEGLLQWFKEPRETRLGMASTGFYGHGGGHDVGSWIWDAMTTNLRAFIVLGVMRHLEQLPLFIDGIGRDLTSDVTTRIMFAPLARFTESMVAKYPEFSADGNVVRSVECRVWDPTTLSWVDQRFDLPVVDGEPLLLVPRAWVRRNLLMSASRFYDKSVLDFAQQEQAAPGPNDTLITTPKKMLGRQPLLRRSRATNVRVTLRALNGDEDLIAMFEAFVAERYRRASGGEAAAA